MKTSLKNKAIVLRLRGLSYSEILNKVPIAKSTLSLWLRTVNLSKRQRQKITAKRIAAAKRGGEIRRQKRIALTRQINQSAAKEVGKINDRELWLLGTALYWAEGSKEKERRPGTGVQFTNSDPRMVNLFLKWLKKICGLNDRDIYFDIFIHENHRDRLDSVIKYWSKATKFPKKYFPHIYFKKNRVNTKRTNVGDNYYGTVKIRVRKSTNLNRKIAGWIDGVVRYFG